MVTARAELIVVAGPNGAGKSTYAIEFLSSRPLPFLSADSIAAELSPDDPTTARIQAGRLLAQRVDGHLKEHTSFVIESTLSGRVAARLLVRAREAGYDITLVFLFLDSVETCLARIRERVRKGGHDVPETDVRRRFLRSIHNFWGHYRQLVDRWLLCYTAGGQFQDVATGAKDITLVRDEVLFGKFCMLVSDETRH